MTVETTECIEQLFMLLKWDKIIVEPAALDIGLKTVDLEKMA